MKKVQKSLFAILLVFLIIVQSIPVHAYEGIADTAEEISKMQDEGESMSSDELVSEEIVIGEEVSETIETSETSENSSEETEESEEIAEEQASENVSEDTSEEEPATEDISEEESSENISEESTEETSELPKQGEDGNYEGAVCDPVTDYGTGQTETKATVNDTLLSGNLSLDIKGSYLTESADTIISRINQIRKEACDNGYINPETKKPFKASDYKPVKWSEDMEAIARKRVVEAAVYTSHERPNGEKWNTLSSSSNITSNAECIAWNHTGLMEGIKQWYQEKDDYVAKTPNAVVGHYEILIDPRITYFSVSCFYSNQYVAYPYTVILEGSMSQSSLSTKKDSTAGTCTVPVEFKGSMLKALGIPEGNVPFLYPGESGEMICNATVSFTDPKPNVAKNITSSVDKGLTWTSSNKSVAIVDSEGLVTAKEIGKTTIKAEFGSRSVERELEVFEAGTSPLQIKDLPKTTYLVGEKMDVKGATVVNRKSKKSAKLTDSACKITGFSTENPGKVTVKLTFDSLQTSFDILVLEVPEINARYGNTIGSLTLPSNAYGNYQWLSTKDIKLEKVGENKYNLGFVPFDTVSFDVRSDIVAKVYVYRDLDADWVSFPEVSYPYTGGKQTPKPILVSEGESAILKEGTDYIIENYSENKNIGEADVILSGEGYYTGTITAHFTITKGNIVITAEDVVLCIGDEIPSTFEYEVSGLAEGDVFVKDPVFECVGIVSTEQTGSYDIVVKTEADAGSNYNITYVNAKLRVVESPVYYDVTFDTVGISEGVPSYIGVPVGQIIEEPAVPTASDYVFAGWYKDLTYKKLWDFEKDIVTGNTTLYAKWMQKRTGTSFLVQAIPDMIYTSKAVKPVITVYDGDLILKEGKDYTLSYKNNKDVNVVRATDTFNDKLPYVAIKGKGNYSSTLYLNFNIVQASIGDGRPASNTTFKYQNQLVMSKTKTQSVFTSLKCLKTMKNGTDFKLSLKTIRAYNESGVPVGENMPCKDAKIPKGYSGSFMLTVEGIGNYGGTIQQEIRVAEKEQILKNATIVLGAKVKSFEYSGDSVRITPAVYNAEKKCYYRVINGSIEDPITGKPVVIDPDFAYLVRIGGTYLIQDRDFTVSYTNNEAVGTATLTIQGKGDYTGTKSINFKIKGKTFSTKNVTVTGMGDAAYTGYPIILSDKDVKLSYLAGTASESNKPVELKWGKDFKVAYKNNINKGTVTVTFTGLESGGYTGKITKKFKITGINIADETKVTRGSQMNNIEMFYDKAGVKPVQQIVLYNASGKLLKKDVDYTLSYKNVTKPATMFEEKAPIVTVKGKGNYSGSFAVKFTILAGNLSSEDIRVEINPTAYNEKKKDTYVYKPTVKVYDGTKTIKAKTDYSIEYINATQDKVRTYFEKLKDGSATDADAPKVRITAGTSGLYVGSIQDMILPIYEKKLEAKYIYILVDESQAIYSGGQLMPTVRVFYSDNAADVKKAKKTKDVDQILVWMDEWDEGTEFEVSYGENMKAGKNKGSVTIHGITPEWGGKLTQKFNITSKQIQ